MNTFPIKVGATVLLVALGVLLLQCSLFADSPSTCMRRNIIEAGFWLLHFSTLGAAIWLGIEAARASKRRWLGWITGVFILVVLNAGLGWMGFELPKTEIEYGTENSYRR